MTLAELRKKRGEPLYTEGENEPHEGGHPSALEYAQIGLILAIITAIEVGIYYINMSHTLLVVLLIILSITKFTLVVLWFMHLRFDASLFWVLFAGGMALALTVFTVVIATQHAGLV